MNKRRILLFLILSFIIGHLGAQNARTFYKTAQDFVDNGNYTDAIEQYSKAIDLEPDFAKVYYERGLVYEKIGKIKEAAEDFDRATVFLPKDEDVHYEAGRLYYELGEYVKSIEKLDKALLLKSNLLPALLLKGKALIKLESYGPARILIEEAMKYKQTAETYYLHGVVNDKLNLKEQAEEDFEKAIKQDKEYLDAYLALADLQRRMKKPVEALRTCNQVLSMDENNKEAYLIRSEVHVDNLDYTKAIDDLSRILMQNPNDEKVYLLRGTYYQNFTQHQNAINDFNKVLLLNPNNYEAYFKRAKSFEEIANYQAAIRDFEKLMEFPESDEKIKTMLEEAKKSLFILNKEENKPEIVILDPEPKNRYVLQIPKDKNEITLRGKIRDESEITAININQKSIPFVEETDGYNFLANVNISGTEMLTVSASDVYGNTQTNNYTYQWTEIDTPSISLIAPYASDNGDIFINSDEMNLYIEGNIKDESLIKTILVDGVSASYRLEEYNPSFSATIGITNKNKFSIRAIDIYGNETQQEYRINRNENGENNPMGKTWVVFVENSDYEYFPSLNGPSKDVTLMKSALANYQIHNFIHKKNMNKKEMERFFSIELRDLIRSNQVDALMVWYAGHGKFINETGYWIPVDAVRDDEFSYFNINALKASMQSYTRFLTHTLVITDACESGPTFYQAMRSAPKIRDCNDWQATRFKSSQVFSSAGYELAIDNSQFTKTFANALMNNPDACIPIESIVTKVTKAVIENNQQKPKFGKISGLEDEDGTFFFISKE